MVKGFSVNGSDGGFARWRLDRPSVIGLPMPGVNLKFVPSGAKLAMRVKGERLSKVFDCGGKPSRRTCARQHLPRLVTVAMCDEPAGPVHRHCLAMPVLCQMRNRRASRSVRKKHNGLALPLGR